MTDNANHAHEGATIEQLESLCESFARDNGGGLASIDGYLPSVHQGSQPTLLVNLLAIEIRRRRAAGEELHVQEFLEKYPDYSSEIRDLFEDAGRDSTFSGELTATFGETSTTQERPLISRLGSWKLERELGRGGMGIVFEAVHTKRGDRVALKTLPSLDGSALHRFKREFRSLAELHHPNLVGLQELQSDGAHYFFTMDLVDGVDFIKHVRPQGVLSESRLRESLKQLVSAVLALHSAQIIHRDIKPSNVLVRKDGAVIVLDFGLVLEETGTFSRTNNEVVGTPAYMAPEQATGARVETTADWYSVGVVLYEALAGKRPFDGHALKVMQDKQVKSPPRLPEGVPTDLAELCMRLLAVASRERPNGPEVATALDAEVENARLSAGAIELVGREEQLHDLNESLQDFLAKNEPMTVFISGLSGEGKSALIEKFLAPIRSDSAFAVMSGRSYDRESVPFKALDSLIDALTSYLRSLPEVVAATLLPDDTGVLVHLFPVLQRVPVVSMLPTTDISALGEQQVRTRAFATLKQLLRRIGERVHVILSMDDGQWSDSDSAEALFEVLRPPDPARVFVINSYRSDEAKDSPYLNSWTSLQRTHNTIIARRDVAVSPLSADDCTTLVARMMDSDVESVRGIASSLREETGGNAFLLSELAASLDPEAESFQPMPIQQVIERKLSRLPEEANGLLEVISVSGQALSFEEAAIAAGHDKQLMATLTHMRNERLIRMIGEIEDATIDTYHDRIRETVLAHLEPSDKRRIHHRLARVIEASAGAVDSEEFAAIESGSDESTMPRERVYDLAYHFDAAGDRRKAWVYGLLAAEQARRQYSHEVAVANYRLARRNVPDASEVVRFRLGRGLGEALMQIGEYAAAREVLESTIELSDDALKIADIEAILSELAFKQGRLTDSIDLTASAIRRIGCRFPRTKTGLAWGLLRETWVQVWHTLWRWRLHRKESTPKLELAIHLYSRVQYPSCFVSTAMWLWSSLVAINRAERLPMSTRCAQAWSMHSVVTGAIGLHRRSAKYSGKSLIHQQKADNLWGIGHSFLWKGVGAWAAGRFDEGIDAMAVAVEKFEQSGDFGELNFARFHLACCHYAAGNLRNAIIEARKVFELAVRIGDPRSNCSLYMLAKAAGGRIEFEKLRDLFSRNDIDILSTCNLDKAEGYWHLRNGRTAEAVEAFGNACEQPRRHKVAIYHSFAGIPALVRALRHHASAIEDPVEAKRHLRRARRIIRKAGWLLKLFRGELALALREFALVFRDLGKRRKALKLASKSLKLAQRQNARYEYAQSLLVVGELRKQRGRDDADEQITEATRLLNQFENEVEVAVAENNTRSHREQSE